MTINFTAHALVVAALSIGGTALAQTAAKDNSAIKSAHTVNDGGASDGANSFTEGEARAHIAHAGYSSVSPLTKDANGIWRGTAMKGGHTVKVGLDFKGNVATAASGR